MLHRTQKGLRVLIKTKIQELIGLIFLVPLIFLLSPLMQAYSVTFFLIAMLSYPPHFKTFFNRNSFFLLFLLMVLVAACETFSN
jgi:hypothetical protein